MGDSQMQTPAQRVPRRTQAQRREEAERQIILSAIRIIADKGLRGLTLAAAGEGAGYSRGIASHHFGKKDDLLVAIVRHITDGFSRHRVRQSDTPPGLTRLLDTVSYYFRGVQTAPVRMRALHLILSEAVSEHALKDALTQVNLNSIQGLETEIRAGIAAKEIRADIDPHAQAILILASLRGVMAQWLINNEMVDLEKVLEEFIANIKRSLQA